MKTKLIAVIISVLLISCTSSTSLPEGHFEVNVKAEGVYDGLRAYLIKSESNKSRTKTDTAIVFNSAFTFKGFIDGAEMRILTIDGVKGQTSIVLEAGSINVEVYKDSIHKSNIGGTINNDIFKIYKQQALLNKINFGNINSELRDSKGDIDRVKSLQKQKDSLNLRIKNFMYDFVYAHPETDLSLLLLNNITAQKQFDYELAYKGYKNIKEYVKTKNKSNERISNIIQQRIERSPNKNIVKVGVKAPNFSAFNPEGEIISLNDIKGKVIIIDFWASWCKPCRIENPNLVKLYKKYHSKGLEIISVSLDREVQKENWFNAIKKDELNWYNVSNLKFWQDPIAKAYGVNSIPATFILDENGTVVAKRLRGAQLEAKIKALLE